MSADRPLVFQVTPLLLEKDEGSWQFFSNENKHDRDTLGAGKVIYSVPQRGDDLFDDDGKARFLGIERRDLPCLWAEVSTQQRFIISLVGLSLSKVGDLVSDLGDAAEQAITLEEWKTGFEERQRLRRENKPIMSDRDSEQSPDNAAIDDATATSDSSDGSLLTTLGRIAGVGGIALGIFYLLLRPLHFSLLNGTAARLFMFLVYGIAVLGLIVWAARDGNSRILAVILALVAIILAFFGLQGASPALGYKLTITVTKLDGSVAKVANTSVHIPGRNVLGNEDGISWSADLPADMGGQTVKVMAEMKDTNLSDSHVLTLGNDYTPKVELVLHPQGEENVTVMVQDERGLAVPNAVVSVPGGAGELTLGNGQQILHTTAHAGDTIDIRAQMNPDLLGILHDFKVGTGKTAVVVLLHLHSDPNPNPKLPPPPPPTGLNAVLDPRTKLTWTTRDNGVNINWPTAKEYCASLRLRGADVWRLPTIEELHDLYDPSTDVAGTWMGTNQVVFHIRNGIRPSAWEWSSTAGPGQGQARHLSFTDANQDGADKNEQYDSRAICVRP